MYTYSFFPPCKCMCLSFSIGLCASCTIISAALAAFFLLVCVSVCLFYCLSLAHTHTHTHTHTLSLSLSLSLSALKVLEVTQREALGLVVKRRALETKTSLESREKTKARMKKNAKVGHSTYSLPYCIIKLLCIIYNCYLYVRNMVPYHSKPQVYWVTVCLWCLDDRGVYYNMLC